MLLSLQRRQQAEEAKARKEIEAMQRREKEREKEEERARKKEEQFARRQAILEAHKIKKAIEEAEREVCCPSPGYRIVLIAILMNAVLVSLVPGKDNRS